MVAGFTKVMIRACRESLLHYFRWVRFPSVSFHCCFDRWNSSSIETASCDFVTTSFYLLWVFTLIDPFNLKCCLSFVSFKGSSNAPFGWRDGDWWEWRNAERGTEGSCGFGKSCLSGWKSLWMYHRDLISKIPTSLNFSLRTKKSISSTIPWRQWMRMLPLTSSTIASWDSYRIRPEYFARTTLISCLPLTWWLLWTTARLPTQGRPREYFTPRK